jgi:hypothetical protein
MVPICIWVIFIQEVTCLQPSPYHATNILHVQSTQVSCPLTKYPCMIDKLYVHPHQYCAHYRLTMLIASTRVTLLCPNKGYPLQGAGTAAVLYESQSEGGT